jgi:hypothetical protein
VIDAGPQDERHLAAVIAAAPGRIERIVSTDAAHSPGASTLAARSGAALHELREGENLRIADAATLHALAPHAGAAQRMFLLVEAQLVFTGKIDAAAWPAAHDSIAWIAPAQGFLRSAARRQQAG